MRPGPLPEVLSLVCVHPLGVSCSPVPGVSEGHSNLVPCPVRAHFLQGALSEEELARLGGQEVATLSPTVRWEIHNISGVRRELWAEEGTV